MWKVPFFWPGCLGDTTQIDWSSTGLLIEILIGALVSVYTVCMMQQRYRSSLHYRFIPLLVTNDFDRTTIVVSLKTQKPTLLKIQVPDCLRQNIWFHQRCFGTDPIQVPFHCYPLCRFPKTLCQLRATCRMISLYGVPFINCTAILASCSPRNFTSTSPMRFQKPKVSVVQSMCN